MKLYYRFRGFLSISIFECDKRKNLTEKLFVGKCTNPFIFENGYLVKSRKRNGNAERIML